MAHGTGTTAPAPPGAPEERPPRLGTFASLRHVDYRYLWIGNLFNMAAQWIQQITIGWLVWELSKSPFWVGMVSGVQALQFVIIGPLGGVAADRLDRRVFLMVIQTALAVAALVFAFIVWMGWVQVWHALVFTFVTGCGFALNQPLRQTLVANTVPRSDLGNAIALNSIGTNITRVVGPALGGILIMNLGPAANFLIQAGLFLGMVIIIFPMRVRYRDATPPKRASMFQNLKEGFTYLWGNRTLFGLTILIFVPNLFVTPMIQMLPVFADEVLHSQANVYGYLVAAYGVGGLLSTITLATFGGVVRSGRLGIAALVAACTAVSLFALSGFVPLSLLLIATMGFFQTSFMVNNNTLVQTVVRDELRGRVMSIYNLHDGIRMLSISVLGFFVGVFTAPAAVAVSGMLGVATVAVLMFGVKRTSEVRQLKV